MQTNSKTIRFKFPDNLTPRQVQIVTQRYGFSYYSRKIGEWIIYQKVKSPLVGLQLTETAKDELNEKLNKYLELFVNSRQTKSYVAMCVKNMTREYNQAAQLYIDQWIMDNITSAQDDQLPWSSGE
jgi:hypothetical protein